MAVGSIDIASISYERAMDAELVETFSNRGDKSVELVRNDDGEFVRRTYSRDAVHEIQEYAGLPFGDAWDAYVSMYNGAGIALAESSLLPESLGGRDPIIAVEYLGELGAESQIKVLPIEARVDLASGLGKLLTSSDSFFPHLQGILYDGFAVHPSTGEPVVVDVDPYLSHKFRGPSGRVLNEARQGELMRKAGAIIPMWANNDEERTALATAYCRAAGEVLHDDMSMKLMGDFGYVHFMSNGFSPEELEKMGL